MFHVIWTEDQMSNLAMNVFFFIFSADMKIRSESSTNILFELRHPYIALNVLKILRLSCS